ncbi:hypothetical protein APF79_11610 [bacterium BRH_c32]|nr:MAG: hypothetical protein APF79_11610 [bacterium BRH_c32]
MFSVKLSQLVSSEQAFANSLHKPIQSGKYLSIKKLFNNKNFVFEKKLDSLISMLGCESISSDKKVIVVFCRFILTIDVLEKRLKKILPDIKLMRIDGTTTKIKERKPLLDAIQNMNKRDNSKIVFLVSQVGDGDLQEIIKKIFSFKEIGEEKKYLKALEKIRFDFQPKKEYLIPIVKKLL